MPAVLALAALAGLLRGGARGRALSVVAYAGALFGKEQMFALPLAFAWADLLGLAPRATAPARDARHSSVASAPSSLRQAPLQR